MIKLNGKGYVILEIILAFVLTFGIVYFLMELTLKLKNKNDDLLVTTLVKTEQAIMYNKLSKILKEENDNFDCDELKIDENKIIYKNELIVQMNSYIEVNEKDFSCKLVSDTDDKIIDIYIPGIVKQLPDDNFKTELSYSIKNNFIYSGCKTGDGTVPFKFHYTGDCEIINNEDEKWKIRFLTSGDLYLREDVIGDLFIVGGGGAGNTTGRNLGYGYYSGSGGGGGGGYANTFLNVEINKTTVKEPIHIEVGAGGIFNSSNTNGGKSYFGSLEKYYAKGGIAGSGGNFDGYYNWGGVGGNGGSGGGAGGGSTITGTAIEGYGYKAGPGGTGGLYGNSGVGNSHGERSQGQYIVNGQTTCEFNQATYDSNHKISGCKYNINYSNGGQGCVSNKNNTNLKNTGNGGNCNSNGDNGIVILRSKKENIININGVNVGKYRGDIEYIDEGNKNWKLKFLTNGKLILNQNLLVDIFVVGGGGGGCNGDRFFNHNTGGGGGGYTNTYKQVELKSGEYSVQIGNGGTLCADGEGTYFMNASIYYADGGKGGGHAGGAGGSGGGGSGGGYEQGGWQLLATGKGGSYGNDGSNGSSPSRWYLHLQHVMGGAGGVGQGKTTCEFDEGTLSGCNAGYIAYSSGGNAENKSKIETKQNTGNGGSHLSRGATGIVIIRNAR